MDEEEVICVRCGASMEKGILNVHDPREILVTGLRLYLKPKLRGKETELFAYACPRCGYVEHYVKDLKSKVEEAYSN
jgi:predicted nucleic-acid-binding Zn-ribbon protein